MYYVIREKPYIHTDKFRELKIGANMPSHIHKDVDSAIKEAKRLANLHKNQRFFVIQVMATIEESG